MTFEIVMNGRTSPPFNSAVELSDYYERQSSKVLKAHQKKKKRPASKTNNNNKG